MFKSKIFFITILGLVLLLTTACVKVSPRGTLKTGIFKSVDNGETWQEMSNLKSVSKKGSLLRNIEVSSLVFDPQNSNTIYLGTKTKGAFVSFDAAETWEKIGNLPLGSINTIIVHPGAKHTIYLAINNQIVIKSIGTNVTWENIYLEAVPNVSIRAVTIDPALHDRIYVGLSDGRIIKSEDAGISWQTVYNLESSIRQILLSPSTSDEGPEGGKRVIYATTRSRGVFRSDDQGVTWQSLDKGLKKFRGGKNVTKLLFDVDKENSLISINEYGMLRTENRGETWTDYKILIPGRQLKIRVLALDSQNSNIIYYATVSALYKSTDSGQNWITKPLPATGTPTELLIDPVDSNILYLGFSK